MNRLPAVGGPARSRGALSAVRTVLTSLTCRCVIFAVVLLLGASQVRASFIVYSGNVPQTGDQNVLINNDAVGTTIQGSLNQSGALVDFTSPSQFLAGPANGQARVEARVANDINSAAVDINDSITVSLGGGGKFATLIFNANFGTGSLTLMINGLNSDNTPASATISLDDDNDPLALGNGSNYFTVVASGGMAMTSVEIQTNANTSYKDLRQVRIGEVPEPQSLLLAAAAAVAGLAGLRFRVRRA